jgi:hypothetical protein
MSMPPVCYLTSTSNLTLLLYVRRLFTRLSDVAPSFIVVHASFAPGIFAPATVVCTQYLSLCTRYLEYLEFPPYPVTRSTSSDSSLNLGLLCLGRTRDTATVYTNPVGMAGGGGRQPYLFIERTTSQGWN